jgi:hypothetical protein
MPPQEGTLSHTVRHCPSCAKSLLAPPCSRWQPQDVRRAHIRGPGPRFLSLPDSGGPPPPSTCNLRRASAVSRIQQAGEPPAARRDPAWVAVRTPPRVAADRTTASPTGEGLLWCGTGARGRPTRFHCLGLGPAASSRPARRLSPPEVLRRRRPGAGLADPAAVAAGLAPIGRPPPLGLA